MTRWNHVGYRKGNYAYYFYAENVLSFSTQRPLVVSEECLTFPFIHSTGCWSYNPNCLCIVIDAVVSLSALNSILAYSISKKDRTTWWLFELVEVTTHGRTSVHRNDLYLWQVDHKNRLLVLGIKRLQFSLIPNYRLFRSSLPSVDQSPLIMGRLQHPHWACNTRHKEEKLELNCVQLC